MNRSRQRKENLDFITRLSGYGSLSSAQTENMLGLNVNLSGAAAPRNKDSYGYTFFTRPDLNLSYDNLLSDRMLTPLLGNKGKSMSSALRASLDPRRHNTDLRCEIIDRKQAFIPLLTNNLLSISGWPDFEVETYTSKEGEYKEAYSMIDGVSRIYSTTDITANFKNIQGDPITLMMALWIHYGSLVYEGVIVPYMNNILENRIDYMTRIYRLGMDSENRFVQKIAACGAAFPRASPLGASFNYSREEFLNDENDQISIPFRAIGIEYIDPILVKEFNDTVVLFNKSMADSRRNALYVKISVDEQYEGNKYIGKKLQNILSGKLYPRIDPMTWELEWYATNREYNLAINKLMEQGVI